MATLKLPKKKTREEKEIEKRAGAVILRSERIMAATEWLIATYPAYANILPLAIGSHKQTIRECPASISKETLKHARKRWCGSTGYLCRLADPLSSRHNLDGTVAGPISNEHRERALKMLPKK